MDSLVFEILLSLRTEDRDAASMLDRLSEMDGTVQPPAIASLYRCLKRAVERGYIEVNPSDDNGSPGRPRQSYCLTLAGRSALRAEGRRLRRLSNLALSRESE